MLALGGLDVVAAALVELSCCVLVLSCALLVVVVLSTAPEEVFAVVVLAASPPVVVVLVVKLEVSITSPVGSAEAVLLLAWEMTEEMEEEAAPVRDVACEEAAARVEEAPEEAATSAEEADEDRELSVAAAFEEAAAREEEAEFAAWEAMLSGVTGMGMMGVAERVPAWEVSEEAWLAAEEATPLAWEETEFAMLEAPLATELEREPMAVWTLCAGKEGMNCEGGGGATMTGESVTGPVGTEALEGRLRAVV